MIALGMTWRTSQHTVNGSITTNVTVSLRTGHITNNKSSYSCTAYKYFYGHTHFNLLVL